MGGGGVLWSGGARPYVAVLTSPCPRSDQPDRALSASPVHGEEEEEKGKDQPSRPPARRGRRRRRNPELDESQYETDYTTAVESSDERDQEQWAR